MDEFYPVYTVHTECHDCYKCVRQCPVKAIRIENGHASVLPEMCIACGKCVRICPAHAKKVRNDLPKVKDLLRAGRKVYASVAPSWAGIFPDWTSEGLVAALKALGFAGVSETALGAQEVSIATAQDLRTAPKGVYISSACPVAVDYIRRYHPLYAPHITPIASPALTHARLLKEHYGEDADVVFIGPCVGKKNEAQRHPELMNAALTFDELKVWLEKSKISPANIGETEGAVFEPEASAEGALYPVEGGMLETIRRCGVPANVQLITVSGLGLLNEALNDLDPDDLEAPVFVEALACPGGCINGPCTSRRITELTAVSKIWSRSVKRPNIPERPKVRLTEIYPSDPRTPDEIEPEKMREALARVGKHSLEDELNCGGCGYDTCRQFAAALIAGNAEPRMCVSHMRTIALSKANALLRCMPSGAVIVDRDMNIIEANEAFARLFGDDILALFQLQPGLEGAVLGKILPCEELFRAALRTKQDLHKEHLPVDGRLFDITIFTIEPGQTVGAIVVDVTNTEMRRDQIARRAREVISRNIATVQEIACRLGEHMAETEILLNEIAEGYEDKAKSEEKEGR